MIEKCLVHIVSNKVVCDNAVNVKKTEQPTQPTTKNTKKYKHLEEIGMDLTKYHPTIIRTMIDGGRDFKIPESIKNQLILFANEAHQKGFNPSLFGYNNTLHKIIKSVHNIPKRKYVIKGKGCLSCEDKKEVESDSMEETDIDDVLSDVENDLKDGRITEVKKKLTKYKHKIPSNYYTAIMKSINK